MKNEKSHLARRLDYLLENSPGMTASELARKIGVPPKTVSLLRHGAQAFTEDLIADIARAFGISVAQFWGDAAYDPQIDEGWMRIKVPEDVRAQWEKLLKEELRSPENMIEKLIRDRLKDRHLRVVADRPKPGEGDK